MRKCMTFVLSSSPGQIMSLQIGFSDSFYFHNHPIDFAKELLTLHKNTRSHISLRKDKYKSLLPDPKNVVLVKKKSFNENLRPSDDVFSSRLLIDSTDGKWF